MTNRQEQAAIDAFRVLAGITMLAACVHYTVSAWSTPALAQQLPTHGDLSSIVAARLQRLPASSAWLFAVLAAGSVTVGLAPRIAAACLAIVLASGPAVTSADAAFDIPLMSLMAVWLVLLPIGRRFALGPRLSRARSQRETREVVSPPWAIQLFAWNLGLIYLNVFCWRRAFPRWDAHVTLSLLVAALVAFWLLAPHGRLRLMAIALQVGLHLGLALFWGHVLGNALLASTSLLHLSRGWLAHGQTPREEPQLASFDANVACALAATCVAVLFVASQALGAVTPTETTGTVLHDLGPLVSLFSLR